MSTIAGLCEVPLMHSGTNEAKRVEAALLRRYLIANKNVDVVAPKQRVKERVYLL